MLPCSLANDSLGSYYFWVFDLAVHNAPCYTLPGSLWGRRMILLQHSVIALTWTVVQSAISTITQFDFVHVIVSNYNEMAHVQTQSSSPCWRQYLTCQLECTEIADWLWILESPHWLKIKSHQSFHSQVSPTLFHNLLPTVQINGTE